MPANHLAYAKKKRNWKSGIQRKENKDRKIKSIAKDKLINAEFPNINNYLSILQRLQTRVVQSNKNNERKKKCQQASPFSIIFVHQLFLIGVWIKKKKL